jgi:putative membrane protein
MLMNGSRRRMATFGIATLALAACSKKENYGADTTAAASTTVSADTSAMAAPAPAPTTWTDANIVALLDEANAADSTAGAVAATKGTAAAVRDFGKRMARDHHQLRAQGQALATKLKVTAMAPSDDPLPAVAQKEMATLNSTPKGKDFDKAYIDTEIDVHKAVLDIATKAAAQTQTAELKALIQKAAPVIQAHLTLAESIQSKMK